MLKLNMLEETDGNSATEEKAVGPSMSTISQQQTLLQRSIFVTPRQHLMSPSQHWKNPRRRCRRISNRQAYNATSWSDQGNT